MAVHRGWRIQGVSVQGYRHQKMGTPCQDSHHHKVTGSSEAPITVLAVADGAGSRPRSDEGSHLAVNLATAHFAGWKAGGRSDAESMRGQLHEIFRKVREEFLRRTAPKPDDFATTLTVVVLAGDWLGHLTVGDGFVIVRAGSEGGQRQHHLLPQTEAVSEYSNETVFLTSPGAEDWVRSDCVLDPGIDGVLLSTDGLTQAALSRAPDRTAEPNVSFAQGMFQPLDRPRLDLVREEEALAAFLSSDRLTRTNADDKTLLRAVRS
jgi:serine/threonine protein phosphatase PrpC